jgi:hypothetical protein
VNTAPSGETESAKSFGAETGGHDPQVGPGHIDNRSAIADGVDLARSHVGDPGIEVRARKSARIARIEVYCVEPTRVEQDAAIALENRGAEQGVIESKPAKDGRPQDGRVARHEDQEENDSVRHSCSHKADRIVVFRSG